MGLAGLDSRSLLSFFTQVKREFDAIKLYWGGIRAQLEIERLSALGNAGVLRVGSTRPHASFSRNCTRFLVCGIGSHSYVVGRF